MNATTISRRLRALERSLGFELFARDDGKLLPTRKCEHLLAHVEHADDSLREAAQLSVTGSQGTAWRELRVTAPPFLINNLFAHKLGDLVKWRRLRVELIATSSNAVLTRREADIAVRIEDRPQDFKVDYDRIEALPLPDLTYAVYARPGPDSAGLPWAGLIERHPWTTGTRAADRLTGGAPPRYTAQHFDALSAIVASGAARALLPDVVARRHTNIQRISDTALKQPLWMLFHKQDRDIPHLRAARDWILAETARYLSLPEPG